MQVHVKDFDMAYEDNGKGIPLVLIHGYPLNRRLWVPQLAGLADSARVIAPDLRGHGASQVMPPPYSMENLADDVNQFLDALGIRRPVVLGGLSMGGYVALAFCRKYGHRLAGLVLTATKAAPDSPEARQNRDQAADLAKAKGVQAVIESMLPKMMAPQTYEQQPELASLVREIMVETSLEAVLGDLAGMKERPDSTATLAQLEQPVLIVHGADDQLISSKEAQSMAETARRGQLEIIPNAGHLLNLEQPEQFNQVVQKFIQSVTSE